MLYNDGIILTEADADEFLESVGVELYENHVMINGQQYPGSKGEAILETNGIFLYEDHILIEGQQAEEYLKKKMDKYNADKEAEDQENEKYNPSDNYGDRGHGQRGHETARSGITSHMDPKYKTARELQYHRMQYGKVMPRTPKNSKEREFEKSVRRDRDIADLAKDMVDRENWNRYDRNRAADGKPTKTIGDTYSDDKSNRYNSALSATRRHLRKELRESVSIFSSINFI